MSDAPERIWAARGLYTAQLDNRWPTPVEYIRADRIEELIEARDTMGHLWAKEAADKQVALGRIEALTEQLEAARADAKEAEAYAEGLEKEIELNEQEACMLENDFIKADKEIDALKAKLAKAVSWLETIRDRAKGDYMANTYYLDALAALATIEGEKGEEQEG